MPSYVTGEGEPYRPSVLLWMGPDGAIVGTHMARPHEILESAAASLRSAIEQPMHGEPHAPDRIRVASDHLAKAARVGHPSIDFVVAPTPELDDVVSSMQTYFGETNEEPPSYLELGAGPRGEPNPEAVADFFDAAAALYRAQPWNVVPADVGWIALTVESHGIEDGVIMIVGQAGESYGIVLFDDAEGVYQYMAASEAFERGEEPELPRHSMLSFDLAEELQPNLVDEVKAHRWKIAGPAAYPWLAHVDEDRVSRPPSARELSLISAICRALAKLMRSKSKIAEAWAGGDPVEQTVRAKTHAGTITVTLRCPHPDADPQTSTTEVTPEQKREADDLLDYVLTYHFSVSKEARARGGARSCQLAMDLAMEGFGVSLATLSAPQLHELVFDFLPRTLSIDASDAGNIIEDLRAFARFMKREYGLDRASAWLDVLDDESSARLEAALSNADSFGPAKALVMAGRAAGFSMDSVEDIEAFMRTGPELPMAGVPQLSFPAPTAEREATPATSRKPRKKTSKKKKKSKRKTRKR
jgi:hypothetical protein